MPDKDNISAVDAEDSFSFESMFAEDLDETIDQDELPEPSEPAAKLKEEETADAGSSPENQQEEAESEQEEQEQADEPASPKDDPERVQYWQSRADKALSELDKIKAQVESQTPLLKYINENPELAQKVYSTVQEHLKTPERGSSQYAQQEQSTPERPQKPEKPSNYDPADAVTDPQSDSYKYRLQLEDYQERLVEYNEKLVEHQRQSQTMTRKQQEAEAQRQQQARELYQEAMYRYNMDSKRAAEFVQWTFKPDYTVEDLVAVFNARSRMQGKTAKKAEEVVRKNKEVSSPPPPVSKGNSVATEESELNIDDPVAMGEAFVDDLFANVRMG